MRIVRISGSRKQWFLKGLLHRVDGPALEWFDGDKEWYQHGKLYREDGPSVVCSDGRKYWTINGDFCTEESYKEGTKKWER